VVRVRREARAADHDAEALETHRHHMSGMAVDWDLADVRVVERVATGLVCTTIDLQPVGRQMLEAADRVSA
jgi:hypothetical protein